MASELQMVSQVVFPVFALSQRFIRHAGTSYMCVCVCETPKATADQLLPETIVSNDRTSYGCVCLNMMKTF